MVFFFIRNGLFDSTKCFFGVILKLNNSQVLLQEQWIAEKKRRNKWVWIWDCSLTRLKYVFSLSGFIAQGHSSYTEIAVTPTLYEHAKSLSEIVENQGWFEYLNCLLSGNWLQWIHCHSPGWFPSWNLSLGLAEPSARLGRLLQCCLVPLWNTWFPQERAQQLLPAHCSSRGAVARSLWDQKLPAAAWTEEFMLREALIGMWVCAAVLRGNICIPRALLPVLGHTLPHRLLQRESFSLN